MAEVMGKEELLQVLRTGFGVDATLSEPGRCQQLVFPTY
jgi:hypothetical protein